jgi:Rieske Fe-S protein
VTKSCDDCEIGVSRRGFLSSATLSAVAALLATACGDHVFGENPNIPTSPTGNGGTLVVTVSDFPPLTNVGGIARVDGGHASPVALVRTSATTFTALSMICTHQGTTIGVQGTGFFCPNHGAMFDSAGRNTGGQSTTSLHTYPAVYDSAADTVTIG